MCYGTKDCSLCDGNGTLNDGFEDYQCHECEGEGWVEDPDVDDVCENCGGGGEVRAYHGDCDVTDCPACKGTGKGCYGSNYNAPEECRCERCTDHLADKADMMYDQMREEGW